MSNDVNGLSVAEARSISLESFTALGPNEASALKELVSSPATSKAALLELASGTAGEHLFSRIAQNPNADEAVLRSLAICNPKYFIYDWRPVAAKFRQLYSPYTDKLDSRQPYSEVFADQTFNNSDLATAHVFHVGVVLAEDLWHDLLESGLIGLYHDSLAYTPNFVVTVNGKNADELFAAILELLYDASWLDLVGNIDVMGIFKNLLMDDCKHYVSTGAYQTQDNLDGVDSFDWLTATVYGVTTQEIQITDEDALDTFLDLTGNFISETVYEVQVVGVPEVVGKRFSDLSAKQITNVITNLLKANEGAIMQRSALAKALLDAIRLHPALTESHKQLIQEIV